jgi:hypothetical protein
MVVSGFIIPRSLRRVFFGVLCGSRESMCYVAVSRRSFLMILDGGISVFIDCMYADKRGHY